jgi:hypothetical protein
MHMRRAAVVAKIVVLTLAACQARTVTITQEVTREVQVTVVVTQPDGGEATPEPVGPKASPTPDQSPTQAIGSADAGPYPDAPLCPDSGDTHENSLFHTLWDSSRGCHFDHEHGQDPFTPEVAATFPGFDLRALIGGVGLGHSNPSSPKENTDKHGGFKWDVTLSHSGECVGGEGAAVGVNAAVIQYHNFGDYSIEFEARTHSAVALMRQCLDSDPTDYGYAFISQLQDYGQRVVPYQGSVMLYPDTPSPSYNSGLKPYFTIECFGSSAPCDKFPTRQYLVDNQLTADSLWVSQPGSNLVDSGSPLFALLFRLRDTYQILDGDDMVYPFTFRWLCSADDGITYDPAGCRYNNSTTRVHQVAGEIPAEWDNLAGFDTDTRVGRITAEGYVTRFGKLAPACRPGVECYPIKLVEAFVGVYGSLFFDKREIMSPLSQPERDIYFCDGQVCAEGDPGAVPSGWIGPRN